MSQTIEIVVVVGALSVSSLFVPRRPPPRSVPGRVTERNRAHRTWWSRSTVPALVVIAAAVLGSPAVVAAVPLMTAFGRRELARRRRRTAADHRAAMALGLVEVATSGLRAGRSLAGALLDSSPHRRQTAGPNLVQLEIIERVRAGRSLTQAVDEALGSGTPDERLIATTIRALDVTGASADDALDRVAEALRERQSSREDARTQAQHALSSAAVLAVLPFVFGAAAAFAESEVARLYATSWLGALCIGVALILVFSCWEWMQRLLGASRWV